MISILIVGNCHDDLIRVENNIRRCTEDSMCIVTTTSPTEAMSIIKNRAILFDLFVINVQLRTQSGYVLEAQIRKHIIYRDTPILFLTKDSYSLLGINPLTTFISQKSKNYISLPLNDLDIQGKFCLYLDAIYAHQVYIQNKKKAICFQTSYGEKALPLEAILFMEIQNKVCTIYSKMGKFLIKRTSLSAILNKIDSEAIVRCHRFYAANLENIDHIEKENARLWKLYFKGSPLFCLASPTYLKATNFASHIPIHK